MFRACRPTRFASPSGAARCSWSAPKSPGRRTPTARFHLAERSYGRFARAVRIGGAFDASRATAHASAGQLRVILPRIEERRGQVVVIAVQRG